MKIIHLCLLVFFVLKIEALQAQDFEIFDAIDTINHELNGNPVFNISEEGDLVILQSKPKNTYIFSLKFIDNISQELQFETSNIVFRSSSNSIGLITKRNQKKIKQTKFSVIIIEIPPTTDAERIVQELKFIKSRL